MNALLAFILFAIAFIDVGLAIDHLGESWLFVLWGLAGFSFAGGILSFLFFIKDYFCKKREDEK
jgi:hypothetical protein